MLRVLERSCPHKRRRLEPAHEGPPQPFIFWVALASSSEELDEERDLVNDAWSRTGGTLTSGETAREPPLRNPCATSCG